MTPTHIVYLYVDCCQKTFLGCWDYGIKKTVYKVLFINAQKRVPHKALVLSPPLIDRLFIFHLKVWITVVENVPLIGLPRQVSHAGLFKALK